VTAAPLTAFASPGPGGEELATLLSVAVRIEPELIRAVRLAHAPRRDVGAEADLWWSDWVGTRSAGAIRLRADLVPPLRERLALRLAADRGDPAWRLWATLAEVHAEQSPALLLEEQLTWTAVRASAGGTGSVEVEELMRAALRAVVFEGRAGVAEWFGAAWHRLPAAVRHTVPAWQLLQSATDRSSAPAVADEVRLDLADVYALGDLIADATLRVRHDGAELVLNYPGPAEAVLLTVPDTDPRMLELEWEAPQGPRRLTLRVELELPTAVRVGAGPVRIRTGRGLVFEVTPPAPPGAAGEVVEVPGGGRVRRRRADGAGPVRGGVPSRNRAFFGRLDLLDRLHEALSRGPQESTGSPPAAVIQILAGPGGIGKTQLALEYLHRHLDEYDLVWWVPAEQPIGVIGSLAELGERLGLPIGEDLRQGARGALDALATGDLSWLLVYDDADDPEALAGFLPASGGRVIVTTRNQGWAAVAPVIEVGPPSRAETADALLGRLRNDRGGPRLTAAEADELAEQVGDLPLALEQAIAWLLATRMPAREYVELLRGHTRLLAEGKPAGYPVTVAGFVALAVERLRQSQPATGQLFELFAFLGGEPVPVALLRHGRDGDVTEPLRTLLGQPIAVNRAVRDLVRSGLARLDPAQRLQVRRLVQRLLRDQMPAELARAALRNVQQILLRANPGDPDEQGELSRQAELGPHIGPADLVHADDLAARRVVLDHARYLYLIGDYENSRRMAEGAAGAWAAETGRDRLGPDGELTLLAYARLADAQRALGDSRTAARFAQETYSRMRDSPDLGPRHEYTLITGVQVGEDLRSAGRYAEARRFDRDLLTGHREVFGPRHLYTLRVQASLAVDERLAGDLGAAFELAREVAEVWEELDRAALPALDAHLQLARAHADLGAYRAGLAVVRRWLGPLRQTLGGAHRSLLRADRLHAVLLRRVGRTAEAVTLIRDTHARTAARFGPAHEDTLAAAVSQANALRAAGEPAEAERWISGALERYRSDFGARHPFTTIAAVDAAIVYRALGDHRRARARDESSVAELSGTLSPGHPYTLCAQTALATDLALAGDHKGAVRLSTRVLELTRQAIGGAHQARDGGEHPELLLRQANLARDLRATGASATADRLLAAALSGLRHVLGREHPVVAAVERGDRAETDIEPPPTS
jgi:tetratricopeptide (TPR) repeat protein